MDKRELGQTGEMLSTVGFGGILVMDVTPAQASQHVEEAIERGVNYFDVAPTYGNAEKRLGPALEPYRDDVFLACKTGQRDREGAWEELHQSLDRLRTDHFDLYQLHAVTTLEEVDRIFAPGGALEAFREARDQGLVRYVGFSAHSEKAALALMEQFDFDTIMFPFNWVCWYEGNFGPPVLEEAKERELGILALKALAKRTWSDDEEKTWSKAWYSPVDTQEEAELAMRFTLSFPVTAAVSPGHIELFRWACDAADDFQPLTEDQAQALKERSQGLDPIFPE